MEQAILILRPCSLEDIPHLVELELLTQIAPWTEEIFKKCLELHYPIWVFEDNGYVIGFVMITIAASECHILNIGVHPFYQRQGYGQQLLLHALTEAKKQNAHTVYLEVRRSNVNAIALYQKLGFKQIAERKDYYPNIDSKEDALVFAIDLGTSNHLTIF